jgi:hypothetical protein
VTKTKQQLLDVSRIWRVPFVRADEFFSGAIMFSKFATRIFARTLALALVASMLSGCAEINKRGGVVAEVEDYVLFVARSKSHRLFRSYLLAGVLLAAARQGGHNEADKMAIKGNLETVLVIAAEAYNCLYPKPDTQVVVVGLTAATTKAQVAAIGTAKALIYKAPALCQFFDEKMARLDYALFRLALATMLNANSNVYLGEIRDKLMGKIPVLSASAKAAINANKAVSEATTIIDDLLNLSFSSAGPVLTLLPLYRDSLELNMWLIIDNLTRNCESGPKYDGPSFDIRTPDAVCRTLGHAQTIMTNGNGDLRSWREFVWNMNDASLQFEAYTPHFFLVTGLMWRTCKAFYDKDTCKTMLTQSLVQQNIFEEILFINGEGGRVYSASRSSPSKLVQKPLPVVPQAAGTRGPEQDPEATGSVLTPPNDKHP